MWDFNWTLGPRPISPKSRLLLSLSETVNKPQPGPRRQKQGNLPLADTMRWTLWALNQYENQCSSLCMFFWGGCHGNRCPSLHTDQLSTDGESSWADALCSCLLQPAAWISLCIYFRSQFGNSITNSVWTQQEPEMWLVLFMTWVQIKNTQNSSNEIVHIYVRFFIIRSTLIVH